MAEDTTPQQIDWFNAVNTTRSHLNAVLTSLREMYAAGRKLKISKLQLKAITDTAERIKSVSPLMNTAVEMTLPLDFNTETEHEHQ